jgi:hypothetical protein
MDEAVAASAPSSDPTQILRPGAVSHIAGALGLLPRRENACCGTSLKQVLLQPIQNLLLIDYWSRRAEIDGPRAKAVLAQMAEDWTSSPPSRAFGLQRSETEDIGTDIVNASAVVAAAWRVTRLFAAEPSVRQSLVSALTHFSTQTLPTIRLAQIAAGPPQLATRALVDLGFDIDGLDFDGDGLGQPPTVAGTVGLDDDSILELIRPDHRFPKLVDTDTGLLPEGLHLIDIEKFFPALRCVEKALELLAKHAVEPPKQLTPATWNTGITGLSGGHCAGQVLEIHGTGFGAVQPAGVVLLLPRTKGWAPIIVAPADWTDDLIKVVLPADIASGAVGFGDAGYLGVYNAWVDQLNAIADELAHLPCAPEPLPELLDKWLAPPNGPHNMLLAGKARIEFFAANGQTSGNPYDAANVLTPGMNLLLEWKVVNASSVRVERVSADGPALLVTDPSQTSANLGVLNHTKPSIFRYKITARGPCGTPATQDLAVVASHRPMLRVDAIDIAQGWPAPLIKLVASKPTLVRVRVRHGLNGWGADQVPQVTGVLRLQNKWTAVTDFVEPAVVPPGDGAMIETAGATMTVPSDPAWQNIADTLNFLIPSHLVRVEERMTSIRVSVTGFGRISSFTGFSEDLVVPVQLPTFHLRKPLEIRYLPIRWGATPEPTDAECVQVLEQAMSRLPVPYVNLTPLWPGQIGVVDPRDVDEDEPFEDILDEFEERHNGNAIWVLMVRNPVPIPDTDRNLLGQAADIPSNVMITVLNPVTAAHELGHCLNQEHIRLCRADGGDSAAQWDGGQMTGVVVDWCTSSALAAPYDLMTYCLVRWPMPNRWQRLFDRVGAP